MFLIGETTPESDGYTSDGRVTSMAFVPDGRLVVGNHRGDVVVVRPGADDRVVREKVHVGDVHVAVTPDGKSFASGGADGQILLRAL